MTVLDGTLDVDSHEMAPVHLWGEVFGKAAAEIAELVEPMLRPMVEVGAADLYNPGLVGDQSDITYDSVWNMKGTAAPGAFDFSRRLQVLDAMGIDKQLIFPSFGLVALPLMSPQSSLRNWVDSTDIRMTDEEWFSLGRAGLDEYNDWAMRTAAIDPDRLRPVVYLPPCDSVSELISETRALIAQGSRVIHIAHGVPPGGRSPAHPDLDPFWSLFADNGVVCTTHLLGEFNFMRSNDWVKAPAFRPGKTKSHEIGLEPYSFATLHLPISNFLACMVLGGVFERHPALRFGVIELGSAWLGPLAESFDMWCNKMYASRLREFISKAPSEYFRSNVRVTPFNEVEPIEDQFTRYPHLIDCYCFSTDYPHIEGGKDIKKKLHERLEPFGTEVIRKFFVDNARLLLPD